MVGRGDPKGRGSFSRGLTWLENFLGLGLGMGRRSWETEPSSFYRLRDRSGIWLDLVL